MGSTKKYTNLVDKGFNLPLQIIRKIFKCEFTKDGEILCRMKFYAQNWDEAVIYSKQFRNCAGVTLLNGTRTNIKEIDKF